MITAIKNFITKHSLLNSNDTVIVGLSGGPDSVFLLHVLCMLKKQNILNNIIAAHLDHEWRKDSHEDVLFCKKLCQKYNVQFISQKISQLDKIFKNKGSKEELGRKARRYFFESIAKEYNADVIALGHHVQDQQETFFIRMLRGATLTGLCGIKPKDKLYIRPLLQTNKKNIINFLDQNNITYLVDESNSSDIFLRNRIRTKLIPAIKACDTRFDKKFNDSLNSLQKTESFLTDLTRKTFLNIYKNNKINKEELLKLHPVLLYRVLSFWFIYEQVYLPLSKGFLKEIIKFLRQTGNKTHQIHTSWSLVKKNKYTYIQKK